MNLRIPLCIGLLVLLQLCMFADSEAGPEENGKPKVKNGSPEQGSGRLLSNVKSPTELPTFLSETSNGDGESNKKTKGKGSNDANNENKGADNSAGGGKSENEQKGKGKDPDQEEKDGKGPKKDRTQEENEGNGKGSNDANNQKKGTDNSAGGGKSENEQKEQKGKDNSAGGGKSENEQKGKEKSDGDGKSNKKANGKGSNEVNEEKKEDNSAGGGKSENEQKEQKGKGNGSKKEKKNKGKGKGPGEEDKKNNGKDNNSSDDESNEKEKVKGSDSEGKPKDKKNKKGNGSKKEKKNKGKGKGSEKGKKKKGEGSRSSEEKVADHGKSDDSGTSGRCVIWGSGSYRMYNGQTIFVPLNNTNIDISHDCSAPSNFACNIKRGAKGGIERIILEIDGVSIQFESDGGIYVNNEKIKVPYSNGDCRIYKCGVYIKVSSNHGTATCLVDLPNSVEIILDKKMKACGLCGNHSRIPEEDLPDFINGCVIEGSSQARLPDNPSEEATNYCKKHLEKYFTLSEEELQTYCKTCAHEYDHCTEADPRVGACTTLAQCSRASSYNGCSEKMDDWRQDSDIVCGKPGCPQGKFFTECAPANPPTCSIPDTVQEEAPVAGCTCPKGYVENDFGDHKCIQISECPCSHEGRLYQPGTKRPGVCDSECTCSEGKWHCSEVHCPGHCKVTAGARVRNFDGTSFDLNGASQFIIFKVDGISISIETIKPHEHSATTISRISINKQGKLYEISQYTVHCDGGLISGQQHNSEEIKIFQSEDIVHVKFKNGINVIVSRSSSVEVKISCPPSGCEGAKGLCSTYNRDNSDDFMGPKGVMETQKAFCQSWASSPCQHPDPPACVDLEKDAFATDHCAELNDPSGNFGDCHSVVEHAWYYERCKQVTCTSEDKTAGLCSVLKGYADDCAQRGVLLKKWRKNSCEKECKNNQVLRRADLCDYPVCGSKPGEWQCASCEMEVCGCEEGLYLNSEGVCVAKEDCDCPHESGVVQANGRATIKGKECVCRGGELFWSNEEIAQPGQCPEGEEYVDCNSHGTVGRKDRVCSDLDKTHESESCTSGCYCSEGRARDPSGHCISVEECPCEYAMSVYKRGSTVHSPCQECVCQSGKWSCKSKGCSRVCNIQSSGSVSSFDGYSYNAGGFCTYKLVKGKSEGVNFEILTTSVQCCDKEITCSRNVFIKTDKYTITLKDGGFHYSCNGEDPEDVTAGSPCAEVGQNVVVNVAPGVSVQWDKTASVSVTLDVGFQGECGGLCGNCDGDSENDLIGSDGINSDNEVSFVSSWRNDPSCNETKVQKYPCDENPGCKSWALQVCAILKGDTFEKCRSKVSEESFYEKCVQEACICDIEGKYIGYCSSVSLYAHVCLREGICVDWRRPDRCPVMCDNKHGNGNWHYQACGAPHVKTCNNQALFRKHTSEGCYPSCPADAPYLDQNTKQCVTLSQCSCSCKGEVVEANKKFKDQHGRECICSEGHIQCKDQEEQEEESSSEEDSDDEGDQEETPGTPAPTDSYSSSSPPEQHGDETATGQEPQGQETLETPAPTDSYSSSSPPEQPADETATEQEPQGQETLETPAPTDSSSSSSPPEQHGDETATGQEPQGQETLETPAPTDSYSSSSPPAYCTGVSGQIYRDGETCEINCVVCTCDGTSGKMNCAPYDCKHKVCGNGETKVYDEPSRQTGDSCCGHCEPKTCRHGGKEYKMNESFQDPTNPCVSYSCDESGWNTTAKTCPQAKCTTDRRTYDNEGCCYTCDNSCKPTLKGMQVKITYTHSNGTKIKDCQRDIMIPRCNGECATKYGFDLGKARIIQSCQCCQEVGTRNVTIDLQCTGGTKDSYTYNEITGCKCATCG